MSSSRGYFSIYLNIVKYRCILCIEVYSSAIGLNLIIQGQGCAASTCGSGHVHVPYLKSSSNLDGFKCHGHAQLLSLSAWKFFDLKFGSQTIQVFEGIHGKSAWSCSGEFFGWHPWPDTQLQASFETNIAVSWHFLSVWSQKHLVCPRMTAVGTGHFWTSSKKSRSK